MEDIVIFGAGGFGREVLWLLEENNKEHNVWNILGFVDDLPEYYDKPVNGYPFLGNSEMLISYPKKLAVVCCIGNPAIRKSKIDIISKNSNIWYPTIISNKAYCNSPTNSIGKGCVICASSIVTVNVTIGNFVHVNLDCTIGHDAKIDDFVTLDPSVNVSGNVNLGQFVEIGTGSQLIPTVHVGEKSIVGAGSVVISSIPDEATAVGSPAKVIKIRGNRI